jgi:hypothetical protein
MQFDPEEDGWMPAHDRDLRLRSPWALAIALALIALTSAALIAAPTSEQKSRPAVAGVLP